MALINLDPETLKALNTDISSLDDSLINNYLPRLNSGLNEISSNVQSSEINALINRIKDKLAMISKNLSTRLPELEQFLFYQIASYDSSVQDAVKKISDVIVKMQNLSGIEVNTNLSGERKNTISQAFKDNATSSSNSNSNNGYLSTYDAIRDKLGAHWSFSPDASSNSFASGTQSLGGLQYDSDVVNYVTSSIK